MNHFYTLHDVVREDDVVDVFIAPGEVSLAVLDPDEGRPGGRRSGARP